MASAGKGVPTKASNPQRKVRRARNRDRQPERKLRHMLKRNGLREAFEYANTRAHLGVLRRLRPMYLTELKEMGVSTQ